MTDKLRFGPGGTPTVLQGKGSVFDAVNWCRENNLGCMELEFVHSTWLKEEQAKELKTLAKKNDVELTAHGSYYINLNAKEEKKRSASIKRVLSAAYRTHQAGGKSVTFHPAFYLKQDPLKVHETVKKALKQIVSQLQEDGVDIRISPETTGKPTQYGALDELLVLASDIEQVGVCIDFAHLHARSNGKYNTYDEFTSVLNKVEKHLGREGLNTMHIHLSGIEYGEKGEKHHLPLKESDMNYKDLLRALKEYKVKGWVISESPLIEQDALYMQKLYNKITIT